jgi:hypothetical protein
MNLFSVTTLCFHFKPPHSLEILFGIIQKNKFQKYVKKTHQGGVETSIINEHVLVNSYTQNFQILRWGIAKIAEKVSRTITIFVGDVGRDFPTAIVSTKLTMLCAYVHQF